DGDYRTLCKGIFPSISVPKAKKSIKLLLDLGLIRIDESGFCKPTQKIITTGEYARDEIIRQYQILALDLAKQVILQGQKHPQKVITKTISISKNGYDLILKHLEKFNREITSIIHKDEHEDDQVCQLNFQLFTHWRKDS
ncbi:MAG: TIGR02147 family protein, partial [Chitinivibrionales bacterium]|nr:TIGR02147 family protein [Chitinivibrionales bacterium]MBD3357523.1 TIGR02147 family protein [Chitinivibrionales bacterium]